MTTTPPVKSPCSKKPTALPAGSLVGTNGADISALVLDRASFPCKSSIWVRIMFWGDAVMYSGLGTENISLVYRAGTDVAKPIGAVGPTMIA